VPQSAADPSFPRCSHEERVTKKLGMGATPTDNGFKEPQSAKAQSRTDEESASVKESSMTAEDQTTSFDQTINGTFNLSKKKLQYLEQGIIDRSGAYDYAQDPDNYKKARK